MKLNFAPFCSPCDMLCMVFFFAKVEYVFLFPPPPQTKYDSVKAKKSLPILPTDSSQLDGVTFDLSATPLQFTSPLKMIV